jgi:uncharacterized protein with HEPN domain
VIERDTERLHHILDAITAIREHSTLEGIPVETSMDAILYRIIVIGEAVRALSGSVKERAPDFPWSDIVGMRDVLTHVYFRTDPQVVLDVVERDLPELEEAVRRLLTAAN